MTGGYPNLVYLPKLTTVDDGPDSANFFFNEVFHDSGAFDAEGVLQARSVDVSARDLDRFGNVYSARNVYDGRAVLTQVARWLRELKSRGVYDQTRIVVVADHGHPLDEGKFGTHPFFRPLLLVKDYNAHGPLETREDFMTNADVPALLSAGLPGAPPRRKASDVLVVHDGPNHATPESPNEFVFTRSWTLRGSDVRVSDNWAEVKP